MKRLLLGAAALLFAAALPAQSPGTSPVRSKLSDAEKQELLVKHRAGFAAAKALAATNNIHAAEQELVQFNRAKAGTARWHLQSAQRLVQLAAKMTTDAHFQPARNLVGCAQKHLAKAEMLATDARERAASKALAGFIFDRYVGNLEAAAVNYEAAVQLDSRSIQAKEALARIRAVETALQQQKTASK